MRTAALLLVTALVFAAWYRLAGTWRDGAPGERSVYAGLLGASQLVLAQVLLGAAGLLRVVPLVALVVATSLAVAGLAVWRARRASAPAEAPPGWSGALGPAQQALVVLALFAIAWLGAAAWLLPPRGIDDIAYHLPPLYEYAQSGRITLLPLELRTQFAMPLGGDFLGLWPVLATGTDTWVEAAQLPVACYGAIVVAALARRLGAGAPDALFAGLLFLFTPVVLAQAGSAYVDVTLGVCHLVLVFAAVRFWETGALRHLALAGLAAGFGFGVKYSMLVAIVGVQPLVFLRLWRDGGAGALARGYALALLAALPLPAYWLVRNALATGFPLFPYDLGPGGLRDLAAGSVAAARAIAEEPAGRVLAKLAEEPLQTVAYFLQDPGLGTLNGGLGLAVVGLGLPALAWATLRAGRALSRGDWLPALFWAQPLLMLAAYLVQTDITRVRFNQRLLVDVAGFALVALAVALPRLRAAVPGAAPAAGAAGVAAAVLALLQVAGSQLPSLRIRDAVAELRLGVATSPFRYLRQGSGDVPSFAPAWEPLDFLTLGGPGWDVYVAAPWPVMFTAPAWGSGLQNRLWNLRAGDPDAGEPDAIVYQSGRTAGWELFYLGREIPPAATAADPRWVLVNRAGPTELWVRRDRLEEPAIRERLAEWRARAARAGVAGQGAP